MHFHILTLFPEMVLGGLNTSIIGRACEKGILSIDAVNIRDYTQDKHKKVDDYPYGGGAGMLMQAQPVFDAYRAITGKSSGKTAPRVVYVTPQGRVFNQDMARELAKEEELVFLCGHYEGIDERVLEEIVTDYVSIGDYVLTGGELPAMVMIDAVSRMVPGVLKNEESGEFESFHENLLEYPQYTRPEIWHGKKVPEVLLSGDHKKVDAWRLERSIERTRQRRPDLYEGYDLPGRALEYLKREKLLHMDMIEDIKRGQARMIAVTDGGVILRDQISGVTMVTAKDKDAGERLLSLADPDAKVFTCHQEFLVKSITDRLGMNYISRCYQMAYTKKVPFPEPEGAAVRLLDESYTEEVYAHYHVLHTREEIRRFLQAGRIYGAFLQNEVLKEKNAICQDDGSGSGCILAGFIGSHEEGGMGMLEVFEPYRRCGLAQVLEKYLINRLLEKGYTPYCQVFTDNEASVRLQEKLGLKRCPKEIFWIS